LDEWEEFETRLPNLEEKADWFHEGKPTNIGVLCGGISGGLVILCFNDPDGAREFFGEERWQELPEATFITKSVRGHHVWLRSDKLIKSQKVGRGKNESWLEIRSDGNFTVAPPSLHPSGVPYQAVGVEHIYKAKDLASFIDKRLSELGLRTQKAPKEKEKPEGSDEFNALAIEKLLENCAFIQYCQDNATTLSEPRWWSMTSVLAAFAKPGREKIHELSQPYPQYTEKETNQKINEALKVADKDIGPHTCTFIEQDLGFACPKGCPAKKLGIKSPAGGAKKLAFQEIHGRYTMWDKKGNARVNMKKLVDDLMGEFTFKTIYGTVRDEILVYQNGVYAFIGEKVIKQECEKRVGAPLMTTRSANEARDHIARLTFSDRDKFNTEKYIINFENGLFDVKTKVLRPHTPDVLSTLRIPVTYDPSARCPKIEKFLQEILREDDIKIMLEFFGYALIPDYSIPVVLILLGDGSNGKTQLLLLLGRFIGKGNYVSVSLQDIENYPFAVANLEGKLLNIQGDLSSKWLSGVGMLKQLSGQDPIYANRKHRDPIGFDNVARLVFASNKPPKIEEDTLAVWRRILPVNLPNKFGGKDGQKEIKNIVNTIATPQELSGLLNLALEGLDRVLTNGDFSYQGTFDERAKHYTTASDPARAFVAERCSTGPSLKVLKSELYQAYVQFCGDHKVQVSGEAQFGKDLRQVPGLSLSDKQYQEKGERVRWWLGIQLQPEPEIDMEV
jgi:putative DNA primase/helicase